MIKKRIFIAVNLSDINQRRIKKEIIRIKQQIDNQNIKWIKPENIHLTLAFLGPFDLKSQGKILIREIRKNITTIQPLQLHIQGLGVFPNIKKPRIIWIGISDHLELFKLERRIKKSLDNLHLKYDHKPFHSHLSIARIKSRTKLNLKNIKKSIQKVDCGNLKVKTIEIMSSTLTQKIAIYKIEEKIYLV